MSKNLYGIEVQGDLFGTLTALVGWKDGGRVLWERYERLTEGECAQVVEAVLAGESRRLVPDEEPFPVS